MKSRLSTARWIAASIVIGTGLAPMAALAQDFPTRPVRIVVPYPPGGSNDIMARIVGQKLSERMGQQFIVENRGGGGGNIGAEAVARSEPNGYTLLLTAPGPLTANQSLFKNMTFNPETAFAPIALIASVPIVLVVHPSVPVRTAAELIALAKSKPGQLQYASSGNGSSNHLATELFKHMANVNLVHVPYRGAAPAMADLLAGHVPVMFDSMPVVSGQAKAGRIRALALGSPARSKLMPDVPTLHEEGLTGYHAPVWYGMVAPAATPKPVQDKLIRETLAVLKLPDVVARLEELGAEPGTIGGEQYGAFLRDESAKWKRVIEVSGAKVD